MGISSPASSPVDSDQNREQAAVAGSQQSCRGQLERANCPQEASRLRAGGPGITVTPWMSLYKQLQNARWVMGTT